MSESTVKSFGLALPARTISFHAVKAFLVLIGFLGAPFSMATAQTISARISVISTSPARLRITAELQQPTHTLSFRNTYAGILGLGERIDTLVGFRADNQALKIQTLAAGEFRSDEGFARFSYEVDVEAPSRPSQMSHVSWLNPDHGLLMMADLLPQRTDGGRIARTRITFEEPAGWSVAANVKSSGPDYLLEDPESAVFLVSRALHEKRQRVSSVEVAVILSGEWPVSDSDVLKSTTRILKEYLRITRFTLKNNAVLMLIPYAGNAGPESWTAETRGNTVVLLLGKNSKPRRVLSRIEIVLSHELLHLWVPNSLQLAGAYDWFFEGFTMYEALRMDLKMGFITFAGYLETLARVYDTYQATADRDRLSLLEASEQRWTTSASLVYEKGMLVAFLYDLMIRKETNCERSIETLYPDLFHLVPAGQGSANETIIKLLTEREALKSFAQDYLERPARINLDAILSDYGISQTSGPGATIWAPAINPGKTQRKLLDCIE
jgi:predicted metalloprotease with PDZ domain